jgi:hypothetical protein
VEVAGGWRNLHNRGFHNMYFLPNVTLMKSRMIGWTGHVALVEEIRDACEILVGNSQGNELPEIRRLRLEDNIEMDFRVCT